MKTKKKKKTLIHIYKYILKLAPSQMDAPDLLPFYKHNNRITSVLTISIHECCVNSPSWNIKL